MRFISRIKSTFTVARMSSSYQATYGTLLVTLLIIPVLNIFYSVLLGEDLGADDYLRTGIASLLVGMCTSVISGIVSKVVTDRNLGIFQEVSQRRVIDLAFWCGSVLIPVLLLIPTSIVALVIVFISSERLTSEFVLPISLIVATAIVIGILMGIAMAGVGVYLSDPYQGANIIGALIPIVSGVIVPTQLYPDWLQRIVPLFPMSGTVNVLSEVLQQSPFRWGPMLWDVGVATIWAFVGLIMVRFALLRIRSGYKFSAI